ncbi:MAG: hypothetical protein F2667_01805 [Actinobacteria bacterium]|uniref:Unannotated protein n=1 Tax=freshwater metagenome TaxID=449393 RepID=A0A6J6NV90_9ZZZZ|nr:hypothetical protein [Actinomycetota bacterium]
MSRTRTSLSTTATMAVVAAATTWVTMLSWRGFTEQPGDFLWPLLVVAVVVAGTGTLCRWWRFAAPGVLAAQVVLSGMVTSLLLSGSPVPVGPAWDRLLTAFADASDSAQQYAAPVPAEVPGVDPLLIAGGLGCLVLVDLLACTLRRVPLAGLPLLTVYTVPVSLLGAGLTWWVFALTAAGFLVLLYLHEAEQVSRWGRALGEDLGDDSTSLGGRTGAVRGSGAAIGVLATGLALAVPLAIPTLDVHLFDIGNGPGGDGKVDISNPMTDLRRDLRRDSDVPLLQVRTDDPDPSYLRIAVLNRFTADQWSSGDRQIPAANQAAGVMPALIGVDADVPRRRFEYAVQVSDELESRWLPTFSPLERIDAAGDWRYDVTTLDFLASDDDLDTAGLDYTMTGIDLDLSAQELAAAPASSGIVPSEFTSLPPGLPPIVRDLAAQVTAGAPTRFQKAVALQDWFRSEFTYDLADAEQGNGASALEDFLSPEGDRSGYCEQFASAMAVMARQLNIPARVAVGFLRPDRIGDDTYEYSAYDLHAWPELFIAGSGWVRFEPTPADRASNVPAYTRVDLPDTGLPAVPTPTGRADDELPDRGLSAGSDLPEDRGSDAADADADQTTWLPALAVVAGLALVVLLLLLPRLVRSRRRERLLGQGVEGVWTELYATAIDLGLAWTPARSPRQSGEQLAAQLGSTIDPWAYERPARGPEVAPEAVAALGRLVAELEQRRYARPGTAASVTARDDAETCLAAMAAGAGPRARRRAAWWPRSVLTREWRRTEAVSRDGELVDHVG